jgi:hypothetical protein
MICLLRRYKLLSYCFKISTKTLFSVGDYYNALLRIGPTNFDSNLYPASIYKASFPPLPLWSR